LAIVRPGFSKVRFRRASEVANKTLHPELDPGDAIFARLLEGETGGPMVMLDSVAGDHGAGAVATVQAMDEYRVGSALEESQYLADLGLVRPGITAHWEIGVLDPGCGSEGGFVLPSLTRH